ncbi:MAG: type ISP restriction/modification enzyme [Candidatus Hodarchaeales archaeon]
MFDYLDIDSFSDMFAQILTYGLFTIRVSQKIGVLSEKISALIAFLDPFLRIVFDGLINPAKESVFYLDLLGVDCVTELSSLFNKVDFEAVLRDFSKYNSEKDPIIHFYELFLQYYDPEQKVVYGAFYTPDSLASFVVRSVDLILKSDFGFQDGLIDNSTCEGSKLPKIQILDPAMGTGTFLLHVIEQAKTNFDKEFAYLNEQERNTKWIDHVSDHLIPRMLGFELMLVPYAITNLKMGLKLVETGYTFKSSDKLRIFLTNALKGYTGSFPSITSDYPDTWMNFLADEGRNVVKITRDLPIKVIIGNPPFTDLKALKSFNNTKWINDLLRGKIGDGARKSNYFEVDGQPLGEKNPKHLNADYVRFVRLGQWMVEKAGSGILAFVLNHSFIDNTTFKGMRQQLLRAFDDIYVVNLHGNARKREKSPDGSIDENIFDIQQGVAVAIFIKSPENKNESHVHYVDVWGSKEEKKKWLRENDVSSVEWEEFSPVSEQYMFYPLDTVLMKEYNLGWKITDIMPFKVCGLFTGRDSLVIQDSPEKVWQVIKDFSSLPTEIARKKYNLPSDTRDWKVSLAQKDLIESGLKKKFIVPIDYRPFDTRFTYYTGRTRGFMSMPRPEIMPHMLDGQNIGLITSRLTKGEKFNHAFVTRNVLEKIFLSSKTSNNAFLFPLYLSNSKNKKINYSRAFINHITEKWDLRFIDSDIGDLSSTIGTLDVFSYIYAVLHSRTYRERYEELLRINFPRIQIATSIDLVKQLIFFGKELISIHLMENERLEEKESEILCYMYNNKVEIVGKRAFNQSKLCFNKVSYFEGISEEIYDFLLGGYNACNKWFQSRKGKELTNEDIKHFQRVVAVITETNNLMLEIDDLIEKYGGWPLNNYF